MLEFNSNKSQISVAQICVGVIITPLKRNNANNWRYKMKTIKFTEAKTEVMKQAINLLDMYRLKSSLSAIKNQAAIAGLELTGRSFKAVYPQLVEFYNQALQVEESETLVIS